VVQCIEPKSRRISPRGEARRRPPNEGEARALPNISDSWLRDTDKVAARIRTAPADPGVSFRTAKRHGYGLWRLGAARNDADSRKVRNTASFRSDGRRVALTTKSTFSAWSSGGTLRRGKDDRSGHQPCAISSPFGASRFSVCYDVRFPELYRACAPRTSSSCRRRSRDHRARDWETRCVRAIETRLVLARPGGKARERPADSRHSMVSIPGQSHRRAGRRAGVVMADSIPCSGKDGLSLPAIAHRSCSRFGRAR